MSHIVASAMRSVPEARISSRARRSFSVALIVLALCVMCASCTAPRDTLGSSVSPCFRALGVAEAAVEHKGYFAGVQHVSRDFLRRTLRGNRPKAIALPPDITKNVGPLCVVLYEGKFSFLRVEHPWPPGAHEGRFAIVTVELRHDHVEASILVERVPLQFTHLFATVH